MTPPLVETIAAFSNRKRISLLVDPKRSHEKYSHIKGTAILPHLKEWCYLVGQEEPRASWWRNNLRREATLIEMAERSFYYLGNFKYHVIKCDKDGAVIIAPDPETRHHYAIYHASPHPIAKSEVKDPLGPGDVLTGVIAAEYRSKAGTPSLLNAFQTANIAVACCREMPYQRMPATTVFEQRMASTTEWQPAPSAKTTVGALLLPKEQTISVAKLETAVPGLLSTDEGFRGALETLVKSISDGPGASRPLHIMLAALTGSGKSILASALKAEFGEALGLTVLEVPSLMDINDQYLDNIVKQNVGRSLLLIRDEALKDDSNC